MNAEFYRELRKIVLTARRRELALRIGRKFSGTFERLADEKLDRPRITQPNSDNEISGPTC